MREPHGLFSDLITDEGNIEVIYKDHLGNLTAGVGHLLKVGDYIPQDTRSEWLNHDIQIALKDCASVFSNYEQMPDDLQSILANMLFNLGRTRFLTFKKMIQAVKDGDYSKAADEMVDSRWYGQVGDRAKRLVARMRKLDD